MNYHRKTQFLFLSLLWSGAFSPVDATSNPPLENPSAAASASKAPPAVNVNLSGANTGVSPLSSITSDESPSTSIIAEAKTKKPKKKSKKSTTTTASSTASKLSTAQSLFVRRIQREWKDAVEMGAGYDWVGGKPIVRKNTQATNSTTNASYQYFCLGPMGSNLFVWHFSFLGMDNSTYDGGIYHGRLILPPEYPSKPPRVQVWTPSGRFVPRADICLSASAFHPETWNPSAYNLRTIIESLRLHILTPPTEIGGTKASPQKRTKLAQKSRTWKHTVVVSTSKKNGPSLTEIDHLKMIQQGVFAARESDNLTTIHNAYAEGGEEALSMLENLATVEDPQGQSITTKKKKKKKSKKKQIKSKEAVIVRPDAISMVAMTVRVLLSSRLLRMVMVVFFMYLCAFGNI